MVFFLKKSKLLAKCVHRTEIEQNKKRFSLSNKKVKLIQRENLNKKERSSPNKKVSERAKQKLEGDKKRLQNNGNLVTGFKQKHINTTRKQTQIHTQITNC